ncbi:MAG TPA: cytochrome c oxidase subunit 3 [Bryobacteraceae bacterium]|jgi:heme/copper-type cytochrome/quinol oxidase subunit 3|nr:cytochrome c oxidase subunit 3 [Bryobacteraceae bacterium]
MNVPVDTLPRPGQQRSGAAKIDDRRGTTGMWLTIATEASLFVMLFFAYFYLARGGWRWLDEEPPKLPLALTMMVILLASSAVLHWGETQVKARRYVTGRAALAVTILMGIVFLVLQYFEYKDHLGTLTPRTNAYGSIFYTLTSFHAAHVVVGVLMLSYVLILPRLEPVDLPPHRPYHNATLYWHFVDFVWIWIVALLYVAPNLR